MPSQKLPIYLDYAAATPIDDEVILAMQPYQSSLFYNPSALYSGGQQSLRALDDARSTVAQTIGARSSEIIFTAGGSESTNLAIQGVMNAFPGAEIVISAIEHDAVLRPAQQYAYRVAEVDTTGVVSLKSVESSITDNTVLVSCMYVNNEVGSVQPIEEIVSLVREIRRDRKKRGIQLPIYVHTDACQAPQYLDCSVSRLGVDMMTLNGGKIFGPKQSGILYRHASVKMEPLIRGGGQEFGLRSGTENVASAVGFSVALASAVASRKKMVEKVTPLYEYFAHELEVRFNAELNGNKKKRVPSTIHVTFPGCDNERVLFALDQKGIYAAAGSACSASSDEPSHVLLAMKKTVEQAQSSIRFTIGKHTTKKELDYVLDTLSYALNA